MDKVEFKRNLEERLINFAVLVIGIVKNLPDDHVGNHLCGQLLRSGTLPSLNYGEALGAESRKDFLHKLGIVLKELRESLNCIKILQRMEYIKDDRAIKECNELIAIFVKSAQTTKANS